MKSKNLEFSRVADAALFRRGCMPVMGHAIVKGPQVLKWLILRDG